MVRVRVKTLSENLFARLEQKRISNARALFEDDVRMPNNPNLPLLMHPRALSEPERQPSRGLGAGSLRHGTGGGCRVLPLAHERRTRVEEG